MIIRRDCPRWECFPLGESEQGQTRAQLTQSTPTQALRTQHRSLKYTRRVRRSRRRRGGIARLYPSQNNDIGQTLVQCHSVHWKLVRGERWASAYLKQWSNVQPMMLAQCRGTHSPPMYFQCYFQSLPTNCHWFSNILWSKKRVSFYCSFYKC